MKAVNIGLIGLGTVGCGTLAVLRRNAEEISRRAGREIRVRSAAVRDVSRPRGADLDGIRLTDRIAEVVADPQVQIVVELAGGGAEILAAVNTALDNGKHIVTANKALIALHGNEIFRKAQANGLMVAFEAAVAGGIPIIKAIREGLAANRITALAGIINGTCNFILTRMAESGQPFAEALAEAQRLGYAEADPAFDIEGIDAAHKLTILASLAFGIPLQFDAAQVEGIAEVTAEDIAYARELGYKIKHLGIARQSERGVELRAHPTLLPAKRPLAGVDGVLNAVLVHADAVGPTLYCGAGAGAEPTASAVVADLVDVVRAITTDPNNRVPHLAFQPDALQDLPILPIAEVESAFYLRLNVVNRPGALAAIAAIFAAADISIHSVIQKGGGIPDADVTIIMLVQKTREGKLRQAVGEVERLEHVNGRVARLRLEELD